jgi:hypothetical protein
MSKRCFFVVHLSRAAFILLLSLAFACSASAVALPPTLTPAPTSPSDNPTAGANRRATQQAQATRNSAATAAQQAATLQAAASQTALAGAKLTQAAQTQEAVHAAATGQAVLGAKSAWPQRLLESFSDNQLGWPTGLTADHSLSVTSTIAGGRYQWVTRVVNGNSYFNLVPDKGPVLSDFFAQVSVTFGQGNGDGQSAYGLAFRHAKDDYGFFGVLKSGGFRILEVHHTGVYQLVQSDSAAFDARPGAANRIGVVGVGPDFVFLINDQVVGQIAADLTAGQIGLGIDTLAKADTAQVDFSEFQINAP